MLEVADGIKDNLLFPLSFLLFTVNVFSMSTFRGYYFLLFVSANALLVEIAYCNAIWNQKLICDMFYLCLAEECVIYEDVVIAHDDSRSYFKFFNIETVTWPTRNFYFGALYLKILYKRRKGERGKSKKLAFLSS